MDKKKKGEESLPCYSFDILVVVTEETKNAPVLLPCLKKSISALYFY